MTTLLSQMPQDSFFAIAEPYDVGDGHVGRGHGEGAISLTMLTDQVYRVEEVDPGQSVVSGCVLAKSKNCPDELMDVYTIVINHSFRRKDFLVSPLTKLGEIPEGGTFKIVGTYVIGGRKGIDVKGKGRCQLTLLPNEIYTIEQAIPDFSVAKGICHVEQRSKTFGDVDELQDVSFTIDIDVPVIPL
jgi:hypothetical protein